MTLSADTKQIMDQVEQATERPVHLQPDTVIKRRHLRCVTFPLYGLGHAVTNSRRDQLSP